MTAYQESFGENEHPDSRFWDDALEENLVIQRYGSDRGKIWYDWKEHMWKCRCVMYLTYGSCKDVYRYRRQVTVKVKKEYLLWYIVCMPKTVPKHVHIRNLLRDETREAFLWAQRLEQVIAVKSRGSSEVFHGKVDHSQPPWNAPAAGLIMELHAWVRFTERLWRRSAGLPVRSRGGSHANTWKALEGLYRLSEAVDDSLVTEDTRWLSSWIRRASIVLGETESLKRLPRLPGEREAKCPWCKKNSLRQMALDGVIFCIDVKCMDEEDRRPKAQLEYFRGEMVLRWQDGVIGAP